jgi:hypothetical protein
MFKRARRVNDRATDLTRGLPYAERYFRIIIILFIHLEYKQMFSVGDIHFYGFLKYELNNYDKINEEQLLCMSFTIV